MSNENKFPEWAEHLQSLPDAEEVEEFVEVEELPEIKFSSMDEVRGLEGDIGFDELALPPVEETPEASAEEEAPVEEEAPAKEKTPMQSSVKAMLNAKEKPAGVQRYLGRRTKY